MATRRRDQLGAGQVVAVQLGQAEHGRRQVLGLVVFEPVPRGIQRGIAQPVRGREVDHATDPTHELGHQGHAGLVRQTQEDGVVPVDPVGIELLEHQVGIRSRDAGIQRTGQRARLRVAGGVVERQAGVLSAQAHQFGTRVPGHADDRDTLGRHAR